LSRQETYAMRRAQPDLQRKLRLCRVQRIMHHRGIQRRLLRRRRDCWLHVYQLLSRRPAAKEVRSDWSQGRLDYPFLALWCRCALDEIFQFVVMLC
jgi:hypothetical protein